MTTLAQIGEELLARRRRHLRAREADGVEAQRQRTFADRHLQIAAGQCIPPPVLRGRRARPWLLVARSRQLMPPAGRTRLTPEARTGPAARKRRRWGKRVTVKVK